MNESNESEPSMVNVATTVLWMTCGLIGTVGIVVPDPSASPSRREPMPAQAEIVRVELSDAARPPSVDSPPAPAVDAGAAPVPPAAPVVGGALAGPDVPMSRVIEPATAFAAASPLVKAERPISEQPTAVRTQPAAGAITAGSPTNVSHVDTPRRLTFGEGEARQPAPEYPREAQLAHQQGSVVVRFVVGEDGRVQAAQAITPCPFAILNQSATRGIRESWRFARGTVRNYEVTIEYTLKRR